MAASHGFTLANDVSDEDLPCVHNRAAQQVSDTLTPVEYVDVFGHCVERHIIPRLSEFVQREAESAVHLSNRLEDLIQSGVSKLEENRERLSRLSELLAACNASIGSYGPRSSDMTESCRGLNSHTAHAVNVTEEATDQNVNVQKGLLKENAFPQPGRTSQICRGKSPLKRSSAILSLIDKVAKSSRMFRDSPEQQPVNEIPSNVTTMENHGNFLPEAQGTSEDEMLIQAVDNVEALKNKCSLSDYPETSSISNKSSQAFMMTGITAPAACTRLDGLGSTDESKPNTSTEQFEK